MNWMDFLAGVGAAYIILGLIRLLRGKDGSQ